MFSQATIFDSHTMYCDFCAWTICGSKKGDIQFEGTLTKYQSFRTTTTTTTTTTTLYSHFHYRVCQTY